MTVESESSSHELERGFDVEFGADAAVGECWAIAASKAAPWDKDSGSAKTYDTIGVSFAGLIEHCNITNARFQSPDPCARVASRGRVNACMSVQTLVDSAHAGTRDDNSTSFCKLTASITNCVLGCTQRCGWQVHR